MIVLFCPQGLQAYWDLWYLISILYTTPSIQKKKKKKGLICYKEIGMQNLIATSSLMQNPV